MKRIALVVALLAVSTFVLAGVATAGKVGQAKTWVYDPDPTDTNTASATWTKDGLELVKNAATEIPVSAGAEFKGLEGQTLTKLSFDVKTTEVCGAGSPRFNVYTVEEGLGYFGCAYGSKENLGNGWTRVTFTSDVVGGVGFGHTISGVEIMRDEQGTSTLRNISVNGVVVDKFSSN